MKTQLDNWETNSRTTQKWTKKLPTFSRLRLEKKRHLFFSVRMDKPGNRSWVGWKAELTWWRGPGKGRCQKNTTPHLLDPLWNKPALVNEPNQKLWFPPSRDWNLGTETVENSLSADSKVWIFPNIEADVGGVWQNHFYILSPQCLRQCFIWSRSQIKVFYIWMKPKLLSCAGILRQDLLPYNQPSKLFSILESKMLWRAYILCDLNLSPNQQTLPQVLPCTRIKDGEGRGAEIKDYEGISLPN